MIEGKFFVCWFKDYLLIIKWWIRWKGNGCLFFFISDVIIGVLVFRFEIVFIVDCLYNKLNFILGERLKRM